MFKATVTIAGAGAVMNSIKQFNKQMQRAIRREVATYAREARDEVKAVTPVLRGRLRRATKVAGSKPKGRFYSYRVIASQKGGPSGQGSHYHFVNYGTKFMAGRHYADPIKAKYARPGKLRERIERVTSKTAGETAVNASK